MRPTLRASDIARAGSPSRAGNVADISTPIIVAEVTSRRRTGRFGNAARTIQYQEAARKKSERAIRAQATSTQVRSERTMLSTTLSTPIFCAAIAVRPSPSGGGGGEADAARDRRRRLPGRAGAGSSDGSLRGGLGGSPSAGRTPAQVAARSSAPLGSGTSIARS